MGRLWCWIATLGFCSLLVCNAAHGQDGSNHPDSESFKKSGYDYLWSVVQNEYDEFSSDDPKRSQRYFELIDSVVRAGSYYGDRFANRRESFRTMYPELLELDDTPPLFVQYMYHYSQPSDNGPDRDYHWHAERLLEISYQMDENRYPPYLSAAAWLQAALFLACSEQPEEQTTITLAREHGIELLVQAASLETIAPRFHEFVAIRIANHGSSYTTLPQEDKLKLNELLRADPNADPWIGQFSSGCLERSLAWESRGGEYAADVTDEQWSGFRKHLLKAHQYLTKAWTLRPMWPGAANELITVTMGQQIHKDRDIGFWFEQAINARIDDYTTYTDFAYALTPKWQGSMDHLYALMRFIIAQSEEHENMGRVLIGVMNTASNQVQEPLEILTDERLLLPATELMLYELDHGPEYHNNPWRYKNLRALALGHFLNSDYTSASELLRRGGGMVEQGWTVWTEPNRFKRFLPLLGSPAALDVIAGLQALDDDQITEAHEAFLRAKQVLNEKRLEIDPTIIGDPFEMIDDIIRMTD